tara:strand:+ start:352 stop:864 length:513 start_codon:yes stop_codon:yes gene_type:complete
MKLNEIEENLTTTPISIIFVNNINNFKLFKIRNLNDNCLLLSNLEIKDTDTKSKYIKTPASINYIKNTIENLIENLKVQFHDIHIINEKLTNVKNKSFCYLTKLESEILIYLISEKETTKKYIKENILNIKSSLQTNSLDSHLTRIRKKMKQIDTSVKIKSKSEKLLITI